MREVEALLGAGEELERAYQWVDLYELDNDEAIPVPADWFDATARPALRLPTEWWVRRIDARCARAIRLGRPRSQHRRACIETDARARHHPTRTVTLRLVPRAYG
jgi:hypothetical protein